MLRVHGRHELSNRRDLRGSRVDQIHMALQRRRDGIRQCADSPEIRIAMGEERVVCGKEGVGCADVHLNLHPIACRRKCSRVQAMLCKPGIDSSHTGCVRSGKLGSLCRSEQPAQARVRSKRTSVFDRCWPYVSLDGSLTLYSASTTASGVFCASAIRSESGVCGAASALKENPNGIVSCES